MLRPPIPELDTPCLVLDLDALERNLEAMANHFRSVPAALRPHAKTHKCVEIARRQVELGAVGITCAKLGEAEVFCDGGIANILIANQVVAPIKLPRLAALAGRCSLTVAVDDVMNAEAIGRAAVAARAIVGVLVELDVGMGRCGIAPEPTGVVEFVRRVREIAGLHFRGLMGYEGHAVLVEDDAERRTKATAAGRRLSACVEAVREAGIGVEIVSAGSTGTHDVTSHIECVTEIQAGSYCLMDARYRRVRPEFENALFLVATVVSRPSLTRVILDCGMKSISHEFGLPQVVSPHGLELVALSEEHATCAARGHQCPAHPGDPVWLLPSHCCTTVNLHDRYWCVRDGGFAEAWPIDARGRFD